MGDEEEACNTGLCLGLGYGDYVVKQEKVKKNNNNKPAVACLDFSFTICPKEEAMEDVDQKADGTSSFKRAIKEDEDQFTNVKKRCDYYKNTRNNSVRKKLRLTKEQSSLLEDNFKLHTTLNSSQKRALAEKLNLKPRQIEVWFQNRRARTKLKQTEVDCEFLKECCESLSAENRRLKRELQELQSLIAGPQTPLFIQLSKPKICSSCEKI